MPSSFTELSSSFLGRISEIFENLIGRHIRKLFRKPSSVIFLGIDNAGKTTLVNKLKNNTNEVYLPTKHAKQEVIEIGNLKAYVVDVGGHQAARIAWREYLYNVDGVVFLVDVGEERRFNEVKQAWNAVLGMNKGAPILVLMNKIDMRGHDSSSINRGEEAAALKDWLEKETGIAKYDEYGRKIEDKLVNIVYVSVVNENASASESALCRGFEWLAKTIEEMRKDAKQE